MSVMRLLKKYSIRPKKRLGQNFLLAEPVMGKIVRALGLSKDDKVLEIGAGLGVMTRLLAGRAGFVAGVEADSEMVRVLEGELGDERNIQIIHGDILDTNLEELLGTPGWLFAGNIPYNITSPLLFHLRGYRAMFKMGVLTVQREVAERIVSRPGCRTYGVLSIAMQSTAKVEKCFDISAMSFFPVPEVDSTVVRISFESAPDYGIRDLDFFTNVVRAGFSTRRKKLKNALAQSAFLDLRKDVIESALESIQISEDARAEELDIRTFARLAETLKGWN